MSRVKSDGDDELQVYSVELFLYLDSAYLFYSEAKECIHFWLTILTIFSYSYFK